jgi:uncharacterized protein
MRIELASFAGREGKFAHQYAPGEVDLEDDRVKLEEPPVVCGRVVRGNASVSVVGKVSALLQILCDRCLKRIDLPLETEFNLEYVTEQAYEAQQAVELAEEDLALSVFDGETIDVDVIVREQLLLNTPSHLLCNESCKGLCPVCGADRNAQDCSCEKSEIDPRWAGLKELVNRN